MYSGCQAVVGNLSGGIHQSRAAHSSRIHLVFTLHTCASILRKLAYKCTIVWLHLVLVWFGSSTFAFVRNYCVEFGVCLQVQVGSVCKKGRWHAEMQAQPINTTTKCEQQSVTSNQPAATKQQRLRRKHG